MALNATLLPGVETQDLLDAINHIASENPNMKIADLEPRLSELSQLSPCIHDRRLRIRKVPDRREDGNDGDDEFEADIEGVYASLLPTPSFDPLPPAQALPVHFKPGPQAATTTPHNITSLDPHLLVKGSDGIRDRNTAPHHTSIFGGVPLADIHASIHAAIPSRTALHEARLDHPSDTPFPSPSPLPRARTAPLSTRFTALRTRSESPHYSRTRLRKQRVRRSAPTASGATSYRTDAESEADRGRSRTRERGAGLVISKPILQHPILVPGVHMGVGGGRSVGTPSPLGKASFGTSKGEDESGAETARRAARRRRRMGIVGAVRGVNVEVGDGSGDESERVMVSLLLGLSDGYGNLNLNRNHHHNHT